MADTVAAPIEQQVNGVEGMLYMSSQSGNDGTYTLTVTFDVGTDLNTALVMVQNRVMLAMPLVADGGPEPRDHDPQADARHPDDRQPLQPGPPLRRPLPEQLRHDPLRDEVLRVDGVADCFIFGERDYSIRAWLDPQKMAALGINAGDVAAAIRSQNLDVPAGQLGAPPAAGEPALGGSHRRAGPAQRAGAIRRHHRQGRSEQPPCPCPRWPARSRASAAAARGVGQSASTAAAASAA